MAGYYYLHTNGDLIFKIHNPELEPGGFVRRVWPLDTTARGTAWLIAVEGLALGANRERVFELAEKWKLTDEDAHEFACRLNVRLFKDGTDWCATFSDFQNLQESRAGFGGTALEALAALAKEGLSTIPEPSYADYLR